MTTLQAYRELLHHADLIASAILRQTNPKADLLSQRKAYKEYGQGLIERGEAGGMLKPIRNGKAKNSPILYSRTQILAFIEAEGIKRNEAYAIIPTLKD